MTPDSIVSQIAFRIMRFAYCETKRKRIPLKKRDNESVSNKRV